MRNRTARYRGSLAALLAGAAALLSGAANAQADVVGMQPLDGNHGFTTFVKGDATVTGNETEGSMAIAGDLTIPAGAAYNITGPSTYYPDGPAAAAKGTNLFVGGRVVFHGGRIQVNQGFVRVVDPTGAVGEYPGGGVADIDPDAGTGQIHINSGQPVSTMFGPPTVNPIDFAGAFARFTERSAAMGTCLDNIELRNANGQTISLDAGSNLDVYPVLLPGTNVLNLTSAQLARISQITIRATHPLLINITDWTTGDLRLPQFSGADMKGRLIVNLPGATEVNLVGSPQIPATIYAPTAMVRNRLTNNIDGAVIAGGGFTHTGGGEIHPFPYAPSVTCTTPPPCPPVDPPVTPPVNPPITPPVTPPITPPITPPVTPPTDPPITPPVVPPVSPPGGTTGESACPLAARLAVAKRAPTRAHGLQRVRYTVTVRNTGRLVARRVTLVDRMPRGLTIVAVSRKSTFRSGILSIRLGNIRPGQRRTVRIVVRPGADIRGRRTNTVRATATGVRPATARAMTVFRPFVRRVAPAVTG